VEGLGVGGSRISGELAQPPLVLTAKRKTGANELRPDVTLLDIDLGGESGFAVAPELGDDGAVWNVILMPVHVKEEFADLIEASPAARFLARCDLSADAISALLSDNCPIDS